MAKTPELLKKYRGNCHCGAFIFEFEAPEITTVAECQCSICTKKAYLWVQPPNPPTIVKDEGTLVRYAFASKNLAHHVSPAALGRVPPPRCAAPDWIVTSSAANAAPLSWVPLLRIRRTHS